MKNYEGFDIIWSSDLILSDFFSQKMQPCVGGVVPSSSEPHVAFNRGKDALPAWLAENPATGGAVFSG